MTTAEGEIHGRVTARFDSGQPLPRVSVTLVSSDQSSPYSKSSETDLNGDFHIQNIPPGLYDLKLERPLFYSATIQAVSNSQGRVILPTLELEFAGMCNSGTYYYRVAGSSLGYGDISGRITDQHGRPVGGSVVVLYSLGSGRVAEATADTSGNYRFTNLQPRSGYWISIVSDGYFSDELTDLVVQPNLESVYSKALESCPPGRCQPHLKAIAVEPSCS